MNEQEVAYGLSFVVFNLINHLNDRLLKPPYRMDIDEATKLGNEVIQLLMNEHTRKAVLAYVSLCAEVK